MLVLVCEVQKAKDLKVSVPFHSATIEICVELVSHLTVVCQFASCSVPYVLWQEHKHFSLGHIR